MPALDVIISLSQGCSPFMYFFCTLIFMSGVVVRAWKYSGELDPGPSWPGAPSPGGETEAVTRGVTSVPGEGEVPGV